MSTSPGSPAFFKGVIILASWVGSRLPLRSKTEKSCCSRGSPPPPKSLRTQTSKSSASLRGFQDLQDLRAAVAAISSGLQLKEELRLRVENAPRTAAAFGNQASQPGNCVIALLLPPEVVKLPADSYSISILEVPFHVPSPGSQDLTFYIKESRPKNQCPDYVFLALV